MERGVKNGFRQTKRNGLFFITMLLFAALAMALSIWGPELLARYEDRAVMDEIHTQAADLAGEGYRYALNSNEKLHILSECLSSQVLPESEQSALTRTGTYAFIVNHRGPSEKEITDAEIFEASNDGIDVLKKLGILPESVMDVDGTAYEAVLYSAIDVLEPRNNVAVWKVSLSNIQKNVNKQNRLIEAYIDADDGKIYEFYARTEYRWEDMNPDVMIESWGAYLGLEGPVSYETVNPLMETTPYFKKYAFTGKGEEKTIVTIGFYEGINELFLKVSK